MTGRRIRRSPLMRLSLLLLHASILLNWPTPVTTEVISLTLGATSVALFGAGIGAYRYLKCKFFECCDAPWIRPPRGTPLILQSEVEERLFGQHIAQETVLKAIRAHMSKPRPSKALVMSFHGWTGSGKNYLAKMIARAVYEKEMASKHVHLFVATLHFPRAEKVDEYRTQLQSWIAGNLTECAQSLFIFDEVDKMPAQLIDAILPFMKFHEHIGEVDPRRSIFLFLSNGGSNLIAERTLDYYERGRAREDITFQEMEEIIRTSVFNEGEGGLKYSGLVAKHMIDYFVPFLPLERKHVIMCFKSYLKERALPTDRIEEIADSLQYFPKKNPIFSVAGCKHTGGFQQVEQKVDFAYADYVYELDSAGHSDSL